ncbi:MAG: serine/threonine-protein kinase [Cyclobacteriaceae bacterium]
MPEIKDIETWFSKALDIPEDKRKDFLETHLQNQPELLDEVLELIHSNNEGLLTQLKNKLMDDSGEYPVPEIDRYQLEEEIGKGGMAVVYRAVRTDGVFDHEVAVKVLKPGMDSADFIARFNQERNVLGRLKHENIAQIYDGGVTSDGRPYFVMELVSGQNIFDYSEEQCLSLKERLRLFLNVCEAIRFAHQNLVVHQDIKPSNILVNSRRQVKLMDFGIARLLEADGNPDLTNGNKPLFTPQYASPEQIESKETDIRTDVYQLGRVLQALIKGHRCPKELKWLVLHAIRKEPENRYQSVGDLIADVTHFMLLEPLSIRNGGWTYAASKFIQRNRTGVLTSSFILLALVILTSLYIAKIKQANDKALFEKNIAESSVDLLLSIFTNAYPSYSKGDTLNVFDLLHIGDSLLEQSKSDLLNGRFSQLIGEIYAGFNQSAEAVTYYKKAIDYLERDSTTLSESRNMLFAAQASLADVYVNLGQIDSAYFYLIASERSAAVNELKDAYRPALYGRLAWLEVNRGNHQTADTLYQKAVDLLAKGDDYRLLANQMAYYARYLNYYDTPGRKEQIDSLYKAANDLFVTHGLDTKWRNDYARLVNFMGIFNLDIKEYDKAEKYFQQAWEINQQLFGSGNLATLDNLNNLGQILNRKLDYMAAQEKFLSCWKTAQEIKLPLRSSLVYYHNYAATFNSLGQYSEAEKKLDSLVNTREKYVSEDLVRLNSARFELTKSCIGLEKFQKAKNLLMTIRSSHIAEFGEKGDMDLKAAVELVRVYQLTGEESLASALFRENEAAINRRLGEDSELIAANKDAFEHED